MQFAKLRLSGFKSFVDPTELVIDQGITGIVGPNGCGKSNLVEALRWVMGETSAKRMRGSEMDDVIFGGTADRPARNLAEVVVEISNHGRTAPAAFNHLDELEICRRIERGEGSDYRINGKSVRARDVQILFQDNGSGADSAALVSQGRVGALINAKPTERRLLLEEAAGITGLHSRRHEAELRLRATETNLTRLEDVIGAMDNQLAGLKKQARQAARYRNLSERIRKTEAIVLHLRWLAAQEALTQARAAFDRNEATVREHMLTVGRATTGQAEAASAMPPLRKAEAEAAAALQRLVLARDAIDAEERRIRDAQADAQRRLDQILGDLERERGLSADAAQALTRLSEEQRQLAAAQTGEAAAEAEARAALAQGKAAVDTLDDELTRLTEKVAGDEAQRGSLSRRVAELEARIAGLVRRRDEAGRQTTALEGEIAHSPDLAAAEAELRAAEAALESARTAAETSEKARQAAEAAQNAARETLQSADHALAKLTAEADALKSVLAAAAKGDSPPLIDAVSVAKGYEAAFGAALGDDAEVPLDEAAPVRWQTLPPLDAVALPGGAEPIAARVRAPAALARRLAHIGLVPDQAAGAALAADLKPGQQLVTKAGDQWRWDGFTAAAGAPSTAAARLQQRNRLADLQGEIERVAAAALAARAAFDQVRNAAAETQQKEREARHAVQAAFSRVNQARDQQTKLAQAAASRQARLAAMAETAERLLADLSEAEKALSAAREALAALPDSAAQRARIAELREAVATRRTEQAARQNALDTLLREAAARRQRLSSIEQEERSWTARAAGTSGRLTELQTRETESRETLDRLADRPAAIAQQRETLAGQISTAETARKRAADALAVAETALAAADKALKAAEAALVEAREGRVRGEADVRAAMTALDGVRERITERLACPPERVVAIAELAPGEGLPEAKESEERLERLLREREAMGPVNLRAEAEADELDRQIAAMTQERDDLVAAIGRLRQGIANLNREARERLVGAFSVVDGHFRTLFVKLFGGGKAELKLTDAEDPLNAGLEIFASPPGKRLQHLSLLSGGEQALTALSLLFAVFLTKPAPICVLDEVDAPLDDANVDRFCTLIEELARDEVTRFLVITHHRMTMARVDRLYGVTMPERGVSQLVSVDLQGVETMRQTTLALV